jgi:hypothetical protein
VKKIKVYKSGPPVGFEKVTEAFLAGDLTRAAELAMPFLNDPNNMVEIELPKIKVKK